MLSLDTHGRVSVGSKILYGHLGTRGDTSGYLAAPYGYVSVVNKFKWLIIHKNRGRKRAKKFAQKLAYKVPEYESIKRPKMRPDLLIWNGNISRTTYCTKMLKHSLKASFQYLFIKFLIIFYALVVRR